MTGLIASQVILRPVISEKSMDLTQRDKYTFAVHVDANKLQVKQAVEELFKVKVLSVNVITEKPREKRRGTGRGRVVGYTAAWRKAIVTLAHGEKIEFFEGV
jgi:large subunit ribosomal protein L23